MNLSFLSSDSNLKPGQKVITWGEGRMFPKGNIYIGLVAEESASIVELGYSEARVKLAVDTGQLEEVFVLMK